MRRDARIDRADLAADDEFGLPLLMRDRILWSVDEPHIEEAVLLRSLAPGPRALLTLESAAGQTQNGGMLQFLYNTGDLAPDAVEAAELIGAREYVAFYADVVAELPEGGLSTDSEEREAVVDGLMDDGRFDDRLRELEDRFYALDAEVGTPLDLALRYVDEHPHEFFLSEQEAAADRDDFLLRLSAHVGAVPRASDDELEAAEAQLSRPLPPLLRRLYREVGAHGWGPAGGFLPLLGDGRESLVGSWAWAREEIHGPDPGEVWPDTMLPIVRLAAGDRFCVDASEPQLEVRRLELDRELSWYEGRPSMRWDAPSLRGWLETWLKEA